MQLNHYMLSSELQTDKENLPLKEHSKPLAEEHRVEQTVAVTGPVEEEAVQSKQGNNLY